LGDKRKRTQWSEEMWWEQQRRLALRTQTYATWRYPTQECRAAFRAALGFRSRWGVLETRRVRRVLFIWNNFSANSILLLI
jgi:hypothetical protein